MTHPTPQSQLLLHLSYELANETKSESGRQLAGLYLKNTITAKVSKAMMDGVCHFIQSPT